MKQRNIAAYLAILFNLSLTLILPQIILCNSENADMDDSIESSPNIQSGLCIDGEDGECTLESSNAGRSHGQSSHSSEEDERQRAAGEQQDGKKLLCEDKHERCELWSNAGECLINPKYMGVACRKSCWFCVDGEGDDVLNVREQELRQSRKNYFDMD